MVHPLALRKIISFSRIVLASGEAGVLVSVCPLKHREQNVFIAYPTAMLRRLADSFNPYEVPATRELDAHIHYQVLKNPLTSNYPHYSTNRGTAEKLKREIERQFKVKIVSGASTVPEKPWFARYELEQGNPTEVLAEEYPLAICRLAILLAKRV
jgi:hypothetical protein